MSGSRLQVEQVRLGKRRPDGESAVEVGHTIPVFPTHVPAQVLASLNGRQAELLEIVHREPGLNIQELADGLRVQRTAAKHHVDSLLKARHVVTLRQGRHVLHFPRWMPPQERKALAVLRIGSARAIVATAFEEPGISTTELADRLEMSPRTVRATVRLLREGDFITVEKPDGIRMYQVHLSMDMRVVWARWFDPARDSRPPSLRDRPTKMAAFGLFLLGWFSSWTS